MRSLNTRFHLAAMLCLCVCATTGCIESTFNLARESRLPAGIAVPPGLSRDDVFLTLDFHTGPDAKFTLRDKAGKKLATVTGKPKGDIVYLSTTYTGRWDSPSYGIIVIDGVAEVIECIPYRDGANMVQNGDIVALFKVIDDPATKKAVLAARKVK